MRINDTLVDVLTEGIKNRIYDITVWSNGGKYWAEQVSEVLFGEYNLPAEAKWQVWDTIPENSYAIDNRKQDERHYLANFVQVFTPEEFIQNSEIFRRVEEPIRED